MSKECIQCSAKDRINHHELNPSMVDIVYESANTIFSFDLPRKYTSTHNDDPPTIYIGVGHKYIDRLLNTAEVIQEQTQILGKWVEKNGKYEIHLKLFVSTKENPNAVIRNAIFCAELGSVLESIALAETTLLRLHPHLASTKIFVHFKSIDPKYDRIEYWHRLGHWAPKCLTDTKQEHKRHNDNVNKKHIKEKSFDEDRRKDKRRHHQCSPQICQSCQR